MEDKFQYTTIAGHATGDFRDRGSKFLAYAWPIASSDDIKAHLQALKKEHPKAVHHCYAWRLGIDGHLFRANDDGEPSGSAGRPILGQLDSLGLTNILVVVVRYFGGTLLGVPGLINAYKTATALAVTDTPKVVKWVEEQYEFTFDYPAMGEVLYHIKQAEGAVYHQDLQLFCTIRAGLPIKYKDGCLKKLSEIRNLEMKRIDR